jgi:hypothetical protein
MMSLIYQTETHAKYSTSASCCIDVSLWTLTSFFSATLFIITLKLKTILQIELTYINIISLCTAYQYNNDHNTTPIVIGLHKTTQVSNNKTVSKIQNSCGSSVGIATGYGLDDREDGVQVQVKLRIFTSP